MKKNCWEVMKCGRTPGGPNAHELGVCPVAGYFNGHAVNCGINGGRICWSVEKTLCGGNQQGTLVSKVRNCSSCDFFHQVFDEEGTNFANLTEILKIIKENKEK